MISMNPDDMLHKVQSADGFIAALNFTSASFDGLTAQRSDVEFDALLDTSRASSRRRRVEVLPHRDSKGRQPH